MPEPFALTQCQTISSFEFEHLKKDAYVMEPKVDGWRMQIHVPTLGEGIQVWTRTNHDATGKMPKVERVLQLIARRMDTSFRLDAEAVFINEDGTPDYNFTARCLGSGADVCVGKQQERGFLSVCVFDVLALGGNDLRGRPLEERKMVLENIGYFTDNEFVIPILGTEPTFEQHTKNFERYKEGSVLKLRSSAYAGRRHKSWLKWKEIETLDVKIVGYKEGQGKYTGLIGAIQFGAPDGTVGFCSGMDDDTRVYISNHRAALLGAVIELKHFGKLVVGYRHPQFIRFRSDLL